MPESVRDLQRKFVDTFVSYHRAVAGGPVPIRINDVEMRDDERIVFKGLPFGATRNVSVIFENLILTPPELGVINIDNIAMHFSRTPDRQWKEGFTWETITHNYLAREAVSLLGVKDPWLKRDELLGPIFNPSYPSYKQALEDVVGGSAIVRAFNNKYWIGVAPFTKTPVLGYKLWYVGKVGNNGEVSLHDKAKHLKEEISMYAEVV
jgi:hypothetical protein